MRFATSMLRVLASGTILASPAAAWCAQAAPAATAAPVDVAAPVDPAAQGDALGLNEIVVTGTRRGQTRMDTSVSVSSLDAATALQFAPRNTAEIFRAIPGIRSESSGGEGNANIAVRGLPISSGGAKFLQLWEDGLPVLEFGDIAFGNADIFLRADLNVDRIESIRGGSASTLASNSPGGVINFLSKTGTQTGGTFALTKGIDFGTNRVDGEYGMNFGGGWTAHMGGFYRIGEGARRTGYDSEKGGQVRGNITKTFDGGYIRANFKYLDDRTISYLPMPLQVTGSNGDPDYGSIAGFDIKQDVPHSRYTQQIASLTTGNRRAIDDLSDGMHPVVKQVGLEGSYEFAPGWTVENRFKIAKIGGDFISLFPSSVIGAQTAANQTGNYLNGRDLTAALPAGAAYTLRYATGPNAGQAINPATLNGNGLLMQTNVFNTKLDTLDNWQDNLKIAKSFDVGGGTVSASGGYYHSRQEVGTTWTWASYLQDVRGDGQSAFVDVFDQTGAKLTRNGQWAYGVPTFGSSCCTRSSYTATQIDAFYGSVVADFEPFNVDASLRHDDGRTKGYMIGNTLATNVDVDGNGVIEPIERRVTTFNTTRSPVDFDYGYWSYSLGVNYLVNRDVALFARYSKGSRANNDRLLFGRILPDGSALRGDIINPVRQAEAGLKYRANGFGLFLTGFYAKTDELLSDQRNGQNITNRRYESKGVELESSFRRGGFSVTGTATYTDAQIKSDNVTPALEGNTPQRQAKFVYALSPTYRTRVFGVGASAIGTTKSYSTNTNGLVMPGYTQVNGFVEAYVTPQITLSVNANNLFNAFGLTEEEEGSITSGATNFVRARSINGRTISASARFTF